MIKNQSDKLKKIQLEMLKIFIEICEKHSLSYFAVGGTLLGAVRHKGFIPWDDDIDVAMPRKDYEAFLSLAQKHLPEHLFLQTHKTDAAYPCNFAKIRNSNTAFVEAALSEFRINHGVYIDIFPLDYYPEKNRLIFEIKKQLLNLRVSADLKVKNRKLKTKLASAFLSFLMPDSKKAVRMKEKLFKANPKGKQLVNNSGAWGKKEIFPAVWCCDSVMLDFENIKIKAPKEFHKFLSYVYGDYMTFPPKTKRKGHHNCTVIDTDKSYLEYSKL